jgi:polysaccharide biosynthesis protein PslH
MKILLLSPYPPYPPHGGGTMRIYRLLRGLAERHEVTCLTFAPDAAAELALDPLRRICTVQTVPGPRARATARRAWTTLSSRLPDMALRNSSRAYTAAMRTLLAKERFDLVQAESIEMAGYLGEIARMWRTQRPLLLLDQFNVEYVLQKRTALTSLLNVIRTGTPKARARQLAGGVYSLVQWAKLADYERRVMQECDAVVAVSDGDAAIFHQMAPQSTIGVVPNGVDTREFSRAAVERLELAAPAPDEQRIVFSGTLDFRPNVDAVTWFAQRVLPLVRVRHPRAELIVVGRRPTPALEQMAADQLITLTGEVPDARPYLAAASVYVVPMRIGGGVRLKLLEALALEAPVVCTSLGAEGVIGLQHEMHCLLADDPTGFARAVIRLLDDPELGRRLGAAGRTLVAKRYDWDEIVPRLEALVSIIER